MERQPTAAFVLTLLAGLWMLGTVGMMFTMMPGFSGAGGSWMWRPGMMRGMMAPVSVGPWIPWFGVLGGLILLVSSVVLYMKPGHSRTWGLVIIAVSVLSALVGLGGLLAGTVGVIGGALALSWKPGAT